MFRTAKLELQTFCPELNPLQCGMRLNRSYQRLLDMMEWSFLKKEALITTIPIYSTGTVTSTTGSPTVTGAGTAFTAAMIGRFIKISDQPESYKITNVVGQTLTLEANVGLGAAAAGYIIYQIYYPKPADCRFITDVRRQLSLSKKTHDWLDGFDPDRDGTGEPIFYADFSDTIIELYPPSDQAYTVRLSYKITVPDMAAETDVPVLQESLIITHAAMQAYRQLVAGADDANRGAKYLKLYSLAKDEFAEAWKAAFEADLKKQSLPTSVGDNIGGVGALESDQFWLAHDPYFAGLP